MWRQIKPLVRGTDHQKPVIPMFFMTNVESSWVSALAKTHGLCLRSQSSPQISWQQLIYLPLRFGKHASFALRTRHDLFVAWSPEARCGKGAPEPGALSLRGRRVGESSDDARSSPVRLDPPCAEQLMKPSDTRRSCATVAKATLKGQSVAKTGSVRVG